MTEKDDLGRLRDLKDTLDACHKENRSAHIMPKECKEYSDILGRRIEKEDIEARFPLTAAGFGAIITLRNPCLRISS